MFSAYRHCSLLAPSAQESSSTFCAILVVRKILYTVYLTFYVAHEYVKVEGKTATCGITHFAQDSLGDIVFVDLPPVGEEFEAGDSFGSVESVKAASDVYAPVSGVVIEINEALSDDPGLVNKDAEGAGWFVKLEIKDESETADLMGPDAYKEHCEKEAH